MNLSPYKELFKTQLAEDNTDVIDAAFILLRKNNPEFHTYFYQQFPDWVSFYYFEPIIELRHRMDVIPEWKMKEADWRERLQKGLNVGKSGAVARALRESLSQYAAAR